MEMDEWETDYWGLVWLGIWDWLNVGGYLEWNRQSPCSDMDLKYGIGSAVRISTFSPHRNIYTTPEFINNTVNQ